MALIIDIKVVVQSGKQELSMDKSGILKCFIKSAPEDGKANREVVQVIADFIGVPKKSVEIIQGLTNRKKRLAIQTGLTYDQFLVKLGCDVQKKIF